MGALLAASYAVVVSQIYSEKQDPVGLCESLFATVPPSEGLSRAFFYSCTREFAFGRVIQVIVAENPPE